MMSSKRVKRAITTGILSVLALGLITFTGSVTGNLADSAGQGPIATLNQVAYADDECDGPHPPPGLDCPSTSTPTATPTPVPGQ